ncbi:hypothetical protein [Thermomonospora cellulosilytica]|uniref:Uncharacterized protein n=1 Tax=Thermomonospora cellulosilytica TaxID=1411118 RepID=A0A7W3MV75_9ACTN|nr:hypothetical protein [Thermomonospora cellulosilytica]MBA9002495.1 hypothetical protein [Thermomonospora cellulosilytica]
MQTHPDPLEAAVMVALADLRRSTPASAPSAPSHRPGATEDRRLHAVPASADPRGGERPDGGPAGALLERCTAVIDAELARLAGRSTLDRDALETVADALHRLADSLLLDRVRGAHLEPPVLAALFDLERTC